MLNQIIREFENGDIIIYKRVGREKTNKEPLYFLINKNEKKNGCSDVTFRSITQVKKFISNLK